MKTDLGKIISFCDPNPRPDTQIVTPGTLAYKVFIKITKIAGIFVRIVEKMDDQNFPSKLAYF